MPGDLLSNLKICSKTDRRIQPRQSRHDPNDSREVLQKTATTVNTVLALVYNRDTIRYRLAIESVTDVAGLNRSQGQRMGYFGPSWHMHRKF